MKKGSKKKEKSIFFSALTIFMFLFALVFMYMSLMIYLDKKQLENDTKEINDIYYSQSNIPISLEPTNNLSETPSQEATPTPTPIQTMEISSSPEPVESEGPTINKKFLELLRINKDVVGWISIDGTNIDYPVLLGDDNNYYLKRDIYEEKTRAASIFMDYRNNVVNMNKNTIMYGHNLDDGTMFSDLVSFVDHKVRVEFIKKYHTIQFDSIYKNMKFEIFSAYVVNVEGFQYLQTSFKNDEEFMEYINDAKSLSLIYTNTVVNADDKIITLSTCNHWFLDSRTVIHAKLVKDNYWQ